MASTIHNKALIIDLLRHGETTAGKCFLGSTDAPLNDRGWQQMQAAQLAQNYQRVISSPLIRCQSFAQQYAEQQNIPLQLETDFREMHFGEWEGQTSEVLWKKHRELITAFWSDPFSVTPPAAEAMQDFHRRVIHQFGQLREQLIDERVLLVCHAGVIKVILCELLGMSLKDMHMLSIEHGRLSRISLWQDSVQVLFINR